MKTIRFLAGAVLLALASLLPLSGNASTIETVIRLDTPGVDRTAVLPGTVLDFTAWAKVVSASGSDVGIGGYDLSLDVVTTGPGAINPPGSVTYPQYLGSSIWPISVPNLPTDVVGSFLPSAASAFQQNLGNGSPADGADGIRLFSFSITTTAPATPPVDVTLTLNRGLSAGSTRGFSMLENLGGVWHQRGTDGTDTINHLGFTFTVTTPTPPVALACPSNLTVPNDNDECSATVNYPAPVASGGAGPYTITCSPLSGSVFTSGTTTVNCTVTDAAAHTATCSFTVTVNDTQPPVITCPPDLSVACLRDLPAPTFTGSVTDNCDSNPVVTHVGDVSAGTHPIHITRTFQATDSSGNMDTCAQLITVTGLTDDLNGDCCVDRTDLSLLMDQIRAGSTDLTYDLNGDGKVDIADARFLVLHFTNAGGAPCP